MRFNTMTQSLLAIFLVLNSAVLLASESKSAIPAKDAFIYTENKLNIMVTSDHPQFTIKLKSNPTTGYSWYLREYDSKLITPLKHTVQHADTKLIGAPGFQVWQFRVNPAAFVVPQQTRLQFVYIRPWEPNDAGTAVIFRVSITSK